MNSNYLTQTPSQTSAQQRSTCLICHHQVDLGDRSQFVAFPCNVRAFLEEKFEVWRCPTCKTIHCLDEVDLDHYYAKYPISRASLAWYHQILYRNLRRQLEKFGFSHTDSLLDYGCGANGLFIQYLRQQGFINCFGFDPYGTTNGFGARSVLNNRLFKYILLQDVLEHIEDPRVLLGELDQLLSPGGYILIGTPNAINIDLSQPDLSDYYNAVHVPYHIHTYTRDSVEWLGRQQGWQPVNYTGRGYDDTPFPGLNVRTWNTYQRLGDGSLDTVFESINLSQALKSASFLFNAFFGYWLSYRTNMAILFHKRS